ncbi:MAG: MATE family efflux transporter [Bacteroidaceae bacterium]|nr:MATE family efflux transporter [Bacteroidaceae bacterium]
MKPFAAHYKELSRLGLPIVIGQLGIILVSFVDTFMVGRHGTNDLGAASFVNNMFNLAIIFATGFSYGLTPIIGKLFGRGKRHEAGGMLKNAIAANSCIALLLMAVMWVLYVNIDNLGQPAELLELMRPYYCTLLLSIPFILLFNAFKQFADGITDTKTPMWILLCGNAINIVGNYILIFGKCGMPELGLLGAGISTLLSRMAMLAIFLAIFFKGERYRVYAQGFEQTKVSKVRQKELFRLGMPVAAQMGMETASFSLATIMVGWLGTTALAAHQIMCTVGQIGFMMYYGMAAAVAVKTSNYCGTGDTPNIRRTATAGFHLILMMAIAASALIFVTRQHIGGIFNDNAEVAMLVAQLAIPFTLYQFGDGMQCNYSNALRGIADVKPVMLYAFIAYFVVSLPAGYIFGFVFDWGLPGVWMSFPFGLTTAGVMFYLRFRHTLRRKAATAILAQ